MVGGRRRRRALSAQIHELVIGTRQGYALMLTLSNVSDIKAAAALLEDAGPVRYLLGDTGHGGDNLRVCSVRQALSPPSPDVATGSEPSATTNSDTAAVTSTKSLSVA